jgi:hypothetical protein
MVADKEQIVEVPGVEFSSYNSALEKGFLAVFDHPVARLNLLLDRFLHGHQVVHVHARNDGFHGVFRLRPAIPHHLSAVLPELLDCNSC